MLAIQYSGLLSCPQSQQVTRHEARCPPVARTWASTARSACRSSTPACTQTTPSAASIRGWRGSSTSTGRTQLGRGWGTAQQPDCGGFSVARTTELLDFARMDLSEFYAEIAPTLPNAQDAVNRVSNRVHAMLLRARSMLNRHGGNSQCAPQRRPAGGASEAIRQ